MKRWLGSLKATCAHHTRYAGYWLRVKKGAFSDQQVSDPKGYPHLWTELVMEIQTRGRPPEVNASRLWNMGLAVQRFDGLVVEPGGIVGFWHRVPAPRLRNGYRPGPTLLHGVLIQGLGGGLCQVSTVLYKLVLRAGLDVLERHSHSIDLYGPERYFILGQDATVAYGYKDLIVQNTTGIPLWIEMKLGADPPAIRARLWGRDQMPITVSLETNMLEELPPGKGQSKPGWRVETIRRIAPTGSTESLVEPRLYRYADYYAPHAS